MKKSEIKKGCIYRNKGKGRTVRRIIAIGYDYKPEHWWLSNSKPLNEPGVLYADQKGRTYCLYLSSFAQWAGAELNGDDES